MKLKLQDRSWEMVFTSFAAYLFPPPPRTLISRPVGVCFKSYQQSMIKGIFFFNEIKKIIVCSHLKKTLEEKVPKLCLLPSNLMRETKVVEAHLKRTMSIESSWNRETSNTWELCYRRWSRQRGRCGWRLWELPGIENRDEYNWIYNHDKNGNLSWLHDEYNFIHTIKMVVFNSILDYF